MANLGPIGTGDWDLGLGLDNKGPESKWKGVKYKMCFTLEL